MRRAKERAAATHRLQLGTLYTIQWHGQGGRKTRGRGKDGGQQAYVFCSPINSGTPLRNQLTTLARWMRVAAGQQSKQPSAHSEPGCHKLLSCGPLVLNPPPHRLPWEATNRFHFPGSISLDSGLF